MLKGSGTEMEAPAQGTAQPEDALGCVAIPLLSPAHTGLSGTAVSQGVQSQCYQLILLSVAVLWLQATSQQPAWPEPLLSLLE